MEKVELLSGAAWVFLERTSSWQMWSGHMAVSVNWGESLMSVLVFRVHVRDPDCWKLPYAAPFLTPT